MLYNKKILKRSRLSFLKLTLLLLFISLNGCTDNNIETDTSKIILLVVDRKAVPLPPPPPPPPNVTEAEMLKYHKTVDSMYKLKRKVRIIPNYFGLDFSKLTGTVPDKYMIPEGRFSNKKTIDVNFINGQSRHDLVSVDSIVQYGRIQGLGNYPWTFRFSNIHFNRDRSVAALILHKNTGESGSVVFLGLEKKDGQWKISYEKELEIS